MNLKQTTAVFLALGLAACSAVMPGAPKSAPVAAPAAAATPHTTPVIFSQPTAKVALAPMTIKLPERRGLGTYTRNVDCWVYVRPIRDSDFPSGGPLTVEVRKALIGSKVDVVPGEKADVAAAQGVDYLITGNVPLAHADLCINDFFNADPADVDAQVTVAWEVWSVRENRIVFQTTTTGTGSAKSPEQVITPAVLIAMGDATEQLLQSAAMQQYLTFGHPNLPQIVTPQPVGQPSAPAAVPPPGVVTPAAIPLPGLVAPPPVVAAALQPTVAPILVSLPTRRAGTESQGGLFSIGKNVAFAVGTDGYVIAPAGDVGGAGSVTVSDATGKPVSAAVVRRADSSGLALLKLATAPPTALPIMPHRVAVGDKVSVLGPQGAVVGTVVAAAGADGKVALKLTGGAVGAPIIDASGAVIGIYLGEGSDLPIAAAFKALTLGVVLSEP